MRFSTTLIFLICAGCSGGPGGGSGSDGGEKAGIAGEPGAGTDTETKTETIEAASVDPTDDGGGMPVAEGPAVSWVEVPEAEISLSAPDSPEAAHCATFKWSIPEFAEATFRISVDGGEASTWDLREKEICVATAGEHTLRVHAVTTDGVEGPAAEHTWSLIPPFEFTEGDEPTVVYRVPGGGVIHYSGLVLDEVTPLNAKTACTALTYAGKSDWQLVTVEAMTHLVDSQFPFWVDLYGVDSSWDVDGIKTWTAGAYGTGINGRAAWGAEALAFESDTPAHLSTQGAAYLCVRFGD